MSNEERDAIIMRICDTLPRNYVNVEETLAEAGFFNLLEAAEEAVPYVSNAGAVGISGCAARLKDAIRRAKGGRESAEMLCSRLGFAAVDRQTQDNALAENVDGLNEEGK